jgi:hypothetical protein
LNAEGVSDHCPTPKKDYPETRIVAHNLIIAVTARKRVIPGCNDAGFEVLSIDFKWFERVGPLGRPPPEIQEGM